MSCRRCAASPPTLEQVLRDTTGGTAGRPHRRARNVLVVSEVALALVLLVGSGLLVRSFIRVTGINPGFDPQGIFAARIRLTPARYSTESQRRRFFDNVVQRLRSEPGVTAITLADGLPLAGVHMVGMNPQRIRPDDPDPFLRVAATNVGPDFFSTMRIPILQGRAITADDDRESAPPVCVVNQALAQRLWPHENPIGQGGMGRRDGTVVGVVGDVRSESLEREGGPAIYCPAADDDRSFRRVGRGALGASLARRARAAHGGAGEDPTQPIASISTYDAIVQQRYAIFV